MIFHQISLPRSIVGIVKGDYKKTKQVQLPQKDAELVTISFTNPFSQCSISWPKSIMAQFVLQIEKNIMPTMVCNRPMRWFDNPSILNCPYLISGVHFSAPLRRTRQTSMLAVHRHRTSYARNSVMRRLPRIYNNSFWELDIFSYTKTIQKKWFYAVLLYQLRISIKQLCSLLVVIFKWNWIIISELVGYNLVIDQSRFDTFDV